MQRINSHLSLWFSCTNLAEAEEEQCVHPARGRFPFFPPLYPPIPWIWTTWSTNKPSHFTVFGISQFARVEVRLLVTYRSSNSSVGVVSNSTLASSSISLIQYFTSIVVNIIIFFNFLSCCCFIPSMGSFLDWPSPLALFILWCHHFSQTVPETLVRNSSTFRSKPKLECPKRWRGSAHFWVSKNQIPIKPIMSVITPVIPSHLWWIDGMITIYRFKFLELIFLRGMVGALFTIVQVKISSEYIANATSIHRL